MQFISIVGEAQLSIANTEFKTLATAFAHREEATWLDLSKQGLTELPDSLFALVNLQYLDLGKNNLRVII